MLTVPPFTFPTLTQWRKSKMLGYAERVLTTQQQMTSHTGKSIIHHTLQKKTPSCAYESLSQRGSH